MALRHGPSKNNEGKNWKPLGCTAFRIFLASHGRIRYVMKKSAVLKLHGPIQLLYI